MIKVLFICHGNICRSPMAEFLFRDIVKKNGLSKYFQISSAATSAEEIGNPVHPGTKRKLQEHNISTEGKYAIQLTKKDSKRYDYFIGMDRRNIQNILRILGPNVKSKVHLLLSYIDNAFLGEDLRKEGDEIADPWYTGDFERAYRDIKKGCEAFLDYLIANQKIGN